MIVQYYYFFLTVCRCGQPSNQVFFGVFCNLEESQLLIDINAWASSVPTYLQQQLDNYEPNKNFAIVNQKLIGLISSTKGPNFEVLWLNHVLE